MGTQLCTTDLLTASLTAEFVQRALLHPIDTIKARLQYGQITWTAIEPLAATRTAHLPLIGDLLALRAAAAQNSAALLGVRSLYRGLVPALIGVVPNALVYMPTYILQQRVLPSPPPVPPSLCVCVCMYVSVCLCPCVCVCLCAC